MYNKYMSKDDTLRNMGLLYFMSQKDFVSGVMEHGWAEIKIKTDKQKYICEAKSVKDPNVFHTWASNDVGEAVAQMNRRYDEFKGVGVLVTNLPFIDEGKIYSNIELYEIKIPESVFKSSGFMSKINKWKINDDKKNIYKKRKLDKYHILSIVGNTGENIRRSMESYLTDVMNRNGLEINSAESSSLIKTIDAILGDLADEKKEVSKSAKEWFRLRVEKPLSSIQYNDHKWLFKNKIEFDIAIKDFDSHKIIDINDYNEFLVMGDAQFKEYIISLRGNNFDEQIIGCIKIAWILRGV